jgi:sarcosine oxidase subunit delta
MRIGCPLCGERDRREFTYKGAALALDRPNPDAGSEVWDDYVHNRENPAGNTEDLWYHDPCGSWIRVARSTTTHAIAATTLAEEIKK